MAVAGAAMWWPLCTPKPHEPEDERSIECVFDETPHHRHQESVLPPTLMQSCSGWKASSAGHMALAAKTGRPPLSADPAAAEVPGGPAPPKRGQREDKPGVGGGASARGGDVVRVELEALEAAAAAAAAGAAGADAGEREEVLSVGEEERLSEKEHVAEVAPTAAPGGLSGMLMEELEQAQLRRREAEAEVERLRAREDSSEELRRLEAELAAERRRAELLEEQIESERTLREQVVQKKELEAMRAVEDEQRAVEAVERRLEEELRRAAGEEAERQEQEVRAREVRARLEQEALQRSSTARGEREMKEKVKAFLTAHGYRHVRAKCNRRTLALTCPLHCAVWHNDAEMVRLLLSIGADPSQLNGWGQTPLRYAQRRNSRRDSHGAVIAALLEAVRSHPSSAGQAPEPDDAAQ